MRLGMDARAAAPPLSEIWRVAPRSLADAQPSSIKLSTISTGPIMTTKLNNNQKIVDKESLNKNTNKKDLTN